MVKTMLSSKQEEEKKSKAYQKRSQRSDDAFPRQRSESDERKKAMEEFMSGNDYYREFLHKRGRGLSRFRSDI